MEHTFVLKGNICYSKNYKELSLHENAYLVCENGVCAGVFDQLPERYASLPVTDYGNRLIIPGMTDLHIHAPQFAFRGMGMDKELMEWLNDYTFKEECKYKEMTYAEKAYDIFVKHLSRSATTRVVGFATIHREATELLMNKLESSGLVSFVGKVNMDRNSPDYLVESTEESIWETHQWLDDVESRYERTKPILTPRFIPTCSNELMSALGKLAIERKLPVQSHLSENLGEIAFVKELVPESTCYGDAYERFGMFGSASPCIMAHCVHSTDEEIELMKKNGVFVAHSPESNINLRSGVAPVSRYLKMGVNCGLATDVAAGSSECMFRAMGFAIQASNLRWRLQDQDVEQLNFESVFYLATRGGGAFFGKVGAFEEGFEFDALVIDDNDIDTSRELTLRERLVRIPYLASWQQIEAKYVRGVKL